MKENVARNKLVLKMIRANLSYRTIQARIIAKGMVPVSIGNISRIKKRGVPKK